MFSAVVSRMTSLVFSDDAAVGVASFGSGISAEEFSSSLESLNIGRLSIVFFKPLSIIG